MLLTDGFGPMPKLPRLPWGSLSFGLVTIATFGMVAPLPSDSPPRDPARWGSDHVGKPVPEYVTGDECLFCHRKVVGPNWGDNAHNRTLRPVDSESEPLAAMKKLMALNGFSKEIELVLGSKRQRFLKRSKAYGKLDLLSVHWKPVGKGGSGKLTFTDKPQWHPKKFGQKCAGCHTTGVDSTKQTFSALSLDCYTCHGNVNLEHSKNTKIVYLSKKRNDPPRVVISICGQCHIRTGKSKSTGLPYPNNFVAGDNLFRDFQVDLSEEAIKKLNPADAHVLANVRDVVILGKEKVTCLTCHSVHGQSAKKHHRAPKSDYCLHCHNEKGPKRIRKPYTVGSKTCEY